MANREATCHCGQLRLTVEGEPFAVSICNCLACQRRTGSAFGMQAGFKADQVTVEGRYSDYSRISDGRGRSSAERSSESAVAGKSIADSRPAVTSAALTTGRTRPRSTPI